MQLHRNLLTLIFITSSCVFDITEATPLLHPPEASQCPAGSPPALMASFGDKMAMNEIQIQ